MHLQCRRPGWSLVWEDPLEEGMATHSSILAWRILMDRGAWWATAHGVTKSQTWLSDYAQYNTWWFYFKLFTDPSYCFPYQFKNPPRVYNCSFYSISVLVFVICCLFDDGHSNSKKWYPHHGFNLHFRITSDSEHYLMCLQAFQKSSLEKMCTQILCPFLTGLFVCFLLRVYVNFIYFR